MRTVNRCGEGLLVERLGGGGVIVNYYCSSACLHCLVASSPGWRKDYLDVGMAETVFGTVLRMGCRSVHIGGGEPFLDVDGLVGVIGCGLEMSDAGGCGGIGFIRGDGPGGCLSG